MLFCFPLMVAIQEISARIGRVTGQGITGNIRAHYFRSLLDLIGVLLRIANTINLGADLGAMAAALKLADRRPDRPLVMSSFRAYFLVDFQPT
jgi:Mn2+/Fe2+ NRAMP family transporter